MIFSRHEPNIFLCIEKAAIRSLLKCSWCILLCPQRISCTLKSQQVPNIKSCIESKSRRSLKNFSGLIQHLYANWDRYSGNVAVKQRSRFVLLTFLPRSSSSVIELRFNSSLDTEALSRSLWKWNHLIEGKMRRCHCIISPAALFSLPFPFKIWPCRFLFSSPLRSDMASSWAGVEVSCIMESSAYWGYKSINVQGKNKSSGKIAFAEYFCVWRGLESKDFFSKSKLTNT